MAKIITINGANEVDELKRLTAITELQEQPTEVLVRLAELSKSEGAVKYLKNGLMYSTLKALIGN